MVVYIPNQKDNSMVKARREAAKAELAELAEGLQAASKMLTDCASKSYIYTADFNYALERVETAWRNVNEAISNL